MDGWMDGWMDRFMDGWLDVFVNIRAHLVKLHGIYCCVQQEGWYFDL